MNKVWKSILWVYMIVLCIIYIPLILIGIIADWFMDKFTIHADWVYYKVYDKKKIK